MRATRAQRARLFVGLPVLVCLLLGAGEQVPGPVTEGIRSAGTASFRRAADGQESQPTEVRAAAAPARSTTAASPAQTAISPSTSEGLLGSPQRLVTTAQATLLIAVASMAPAALLMVTAFVRISIVLTLLRQALGSPQVPGNQVMAALALMLTLIVMKPVADEVYRLGIEPYSAGRISAAAAWEVGSKPVKSFMIEQIYRTGHEHYLREIYDRAEPPTPNRVEPSSADQLELRIVAPAFLLSELTTALLMGFAIYLPFLIVDLVVSAVLAAMGLFMLPPSLVALPLKLIVFVLADGWMLVASMLLRSFEHI
jgi:flagellar biosynthesis protein FliP